MENLKTNQRELYKEFSFLDIYWNQEIKCVEMEWKSYAREDDFRLGLNEGLNLVIKKGANKWLANTLNLKVVAQEDQKWANEDWFPRAIAGGIKFMAILIPQSIIAKMSVQEIMSKVVEINLESHYFDDISKAKDWLKQK